MTSFLLFRYLNPFFIIKTVHSPFLLLAWCAKSLSSLLSELCSTTLCWGGEEMPLHWHRRRVQGSNKAVLAYPTWGSTSSTWSQHSPRIKRQVQRGHVCGYIRMVIHGVVDLVPRGAEEYRRGRAWRRFCSKSSYSRLSSRNKVFCVSSSAWSL